MTWQTSPKLEFGYLIHNFHNAEQLIVLFQSAARSAAMTAEIAASICEFSPQTPARQNRLSAAIG